jgi:hypothetical protein
MYALIYFLWVRTAIFTSGAIERREALRLQKIHIRMCYRTSKKTHLVSIYMASKHIADIITQLDNKLTAARYDTPIHLINCFLGHC